MWLFKKAIPDGTPWIDYKEATKANPELSFTFRIENFLSFILREICVYFQCGENGNAQSQLAVTAQVSSTQNLFSPKAIPPELISSPSQNFRQGVFDEEAQGMRLSPVVWNFPCDKGDTITVTVSGAPVRLLIGCMIAGRKYGGEPCR